MTSAVIVSTARTPLAKSWKGAFNMTHGATLGGHAVQGTRSSAPASTPPRSTTSSWAAPTPEGATGSNIARQIALRAGLPITTSRHDRQPLLLVAACRPSRWRRSASSPARATSYVAGGVESISCVQNEDEQAHARRPVAGRAQARDLLDHAADGRAGRQALQHRAASAWTSTAPRSQQKAARRARRRQVQRRDRADHRRWPASPTR